MTAGVRGDPAVAFSEKKSATAVVPLPSIGDVVPDFDSLTLVNNFEPARG